VEAGEKSEAIMKRSVFVGIVLALALVSNLRTAEAQNQTYLPAVQPPFPPLSAGQQQFLDNVLKFWEQRSQAIERYRCTFRRWEYDPVFGPRDTFKTFSEGQIKYEAPDKGMFKVDKILVYQPPANPGDEPQYVERPGASNEHWICDGQSIFEHDHKNKRLVQQELPPHMRGKAISEGPLPFLFGAEAEKIKQRYWIHPLSPPKDVKNEYWLEAFPKTRKDATNYKMVHVIIAKEDFLPKALTVFDRNWDPRRNPAKTSFTFVSREVNWNMLLDQLQPWKKHFYQPKTPFGWKKVVEKYEVPPDSHHFAPAAIGNVNQAQRNTNDRTPR
jgi:TIGR03009 family protein